MKLHGHLVEVAWDGSTLLAKGTTAEGRELVNAGEDHDRLSLVVDEIEAVAFLEAPLKVGGVVIVIDHSLTEHRLHFRRVSREGFERLAEEIDAEIRMRPPAQETDGSVDDAPQGTADGGTAEGTTDGTQPPVDAGAGARDREVPA
jgi:hypothetical protein